MKAMKTIQVYSLLTICMLAFTAGIRINNYEVGDAVSDFKLKNVDGKMVSLLDYESSKGVIIIFDCNTCPYSKAYNERIIALNTKYASQGFPVIAINPNNADVSPGDSYERMISLAREKHYTFPYLYDPTQHATKAFGASSTPHAFVLKNEEEAFKVAYVGAIDNNVRDASKADKKYIEEAVDALLAGKPVTTPKTKAIGCGVKWKK
jgi:peroxiredoxin